MTPRSSAARASRMGFTLIELLLVIGIIAILASIVIVAINPTRQLASARNAQRHSDVNTIINSVYQYAIDKNNLPSSITATETPICKMSTMPSAGECVTLRMLSGTYVVAMPTDPQTAAGSGWTGYTIMKDATTSRITVRAYKTEAPESVISVSR